MSVEFVTCPVCKQKLGLINYMVVGTEVVCANCETNLRVEKRNPLQVKHIPVSDTRNANDRPESYG
ncbi:hypothetical protein F8S13_27195 [Chloroflexia bacterium SDU3-3]|nr:hypothetical protein F8S13_27195 [Chloroflexia bacterium SDU3-3]